MSTDPDEQTERETAETDENTRTGSRDAKGGSEETKAEDEEARTENGDARAESGRDATRYLYLGALGVLVVLAVVGLFGFYTSVTRVIDVWVTEQYQPVFGAVFNLVVLLAAAAGIARLAPLVRDSD